MDSISVLASCLPVLLNRDPHRMLDLMLHQLDHALVVARWRWRYRSSIASAMLRASGPRMCGGFIARLAGPCQPGTLDSRSLLASAPPVLDPGELNLERARMTEKTACEMGPLS